MRHFLAMACLIVWLQTTPAAPRPNFLIVLADDMGYSDAGCYGGEIATPNLDSLAEGGLRYAQFYSTGRCWPSRAALMTGYYAQQVRRDAFADEKLGGRPAWAPLLSTLLKQAGYRCYHTGKWHLDGEPLDNGFDRSYSLHDQDRLFSPKVHFLDGVPLPQPSPESGYYATRVIADYAVDFLKEHAANCPDQPFLHYLAFTSPHFPLQALTEDIDRYRDRFLAGWDALREARWKRLTELGLIHCPLSDFDPAIVPPYNLSAEVLTERIGSGEVAHAVPWDSLTDEQRRFQATKMAIHAAMIDRMDRELGRVLDQLKAMGAYDNTVVLFMSDNGASAEQLIRGDGHDTSAAPGSAGSYLGLGPGFSSLANTPFRLHKIWTNEGGISSPLIIHWPAGIAARGEVRQQAGHFIDISPTILELAGVTSPGISGAPEAPGRSLVSSFGADNNVERPYLWWLHEGRGALRAGDWKVVKREDETAWALYDLSVDRSEMHNLAGAKPEVVAQLAGTWEAAAGQFRKDAAE
jgi:arylsulfatase